MPRNYRRGGALAGILLMVLMLGVLGIAALVTTGLYFADHVRVTERDARGEATLETPFGTVRVRDNARFDPRHMGVPVYPGAVRDDESRKLASFRFDFGDIHKGFAISTATYRTSDSIDRVTDFYRSELPHWMISQRDSGGLQLSLTRHGYKRMVAICEEDGETRIALASMGEPASN
ncbi:MAG TPA: hypothetical protein VMR62_00485 [Bryobacteraceae bacterium]|jgi:hypothetical protein|nr:hypothetical protein [Bryobacteraceae bacterium]